MKKLNIVFVLLGCSVFLNQSIAKNLTLGICHGEYALCAASGATPTGNTIKVNGHKFDEAVAICPVLKGDSVANLDLMNGSCDAPPGKVWSLFSSQFSFPQATTWSNSTAQPRSFITTSASGGGMSDMWSFICDKQLKKVNGVTLANCYGPINFNPLTNTSVPVGSTVITQAPVGVMNPVSSEIPTVTVKK
jgi:hypothetical protein